MCRRAWVDAAPRVNPRASSDADYIPVARVGRAVQWCAARRAACLADGDGDRAIGDLAAGRPCRVVAMRCTAASGWLGLASPAPPWPAPEPESARAWSPARPAAIATVAVAALSRNEHVLHLLGQRELVADVAQQLRELGAERLADRRRAARWTPPSGPARSRTDSRGSRWRRWRPRAGCGAAPAGAHAARHRSHGVAGPSHLPWKARCPQRYPLPGPTTASHLRYLARPSPSAGQLWYSRHKLPLGEVLHEQAGGPAVTLPERIAARPPRQREFAHG